MQAGKLGTNRDVLAKDKEVAKVLSAKEIDAVMDPENYIGSSVEIVDAVVKKLT